MGLENTHYDAFISYRHCDLDMYVAKTLHRYLESFRLPSSVAKAHPELPKKISRVFRDQEELPLSANLSDPITTALSNSDNLIVIASPRLRDSIWCRKEIETFISLRGREHIFVVLAEGEPGESFPEVLLKDAEGRPIEPLAADFRGKDHAAIKKRMAEEGLRLIAPMFGLTYDDLRQRHREQKMKQAVTVASVIMAGALAFGSYCAVTTIEIRKQAEEIAGKNQEILQQNDEISRQNGEILRQSEELAQQYTESMRKYQISVAEISDILMGQGRRNEAVYALYSVMPHTKEDPEVPYVAEAEAALANALAIYSNGDHFTPQFNYNADAGIRDMEVSESGKRFAICDRRGDLVVYDTENGLPVMGLDLGNSILAGSDLRFVDDEHLLVSESDGVYLYDTNSRSRESVAENGKVYLSPDHSETIVLGTKITGYDLEAGRILFSQDFEVNSFNSNVDEACFSEDGRYFALTVNTNTMDPSSDKIIQVFDSANGELVMEYRLENKDVFFSSICMHGDVLYLAYSESENYMDMLGGVMALDLQDGAILWQKLYNDGMLSDLRYYDIGTEQLLYAHDTGEMFTVDARTGELRGRSGNSQFIALSCPLGDNGVELVIGNDGLVNFYIVDTATTMMNSWYTHAPDGFISKAEYASGRLFYAMNGTNYVTQYAGMVNEEISVIGSKRAGTDNNSYGHISPDGKYALHQFTLDDGYEYAVYDVASGQECGRFTSDGYVCTFLQDGTDRVLITGSIYELYETDGSMISSGAADNYKHFNYASADGTWLYYMTLANGENVVELVSVLTGETLEYTDPTGEVFSYNMTLSASPDGKTITVADPELDGLYVFRQGGGEPQHLEGISYGNVKNLFYTEDGKYILEFFDTGVIRILSAISYAEVKTLYFDEAGVDMGVSCIPATEGYLLIFGDGYILDSDLNITARIENCIGYDADNDSITISSSNRILSSPRFSYEELINYAEGVVQACSPDERILMRYGIN